MFDYEFHIEVKRVVCCECMTNMFVDTNIPVQIFDSCLLVSELWVAALASEVRV